MCVCVLRLYLRPLLSAKLYFISSTFSDWGGAGSLVWVLSQSSTTHLHLGPLLMLSVHLVTPQSVFPSSGIVMCAVSLTTACKALCTLSPMLFYDCVHVWWTCWSQPSETLFSEAVEHLQSHQQQTSLFSI